MTALLVSLPTPADTDGFGRRLGQLLTAGDVVILSGALGAGKTALTKGIGSGMGVQGRISSPTFVIAREHPGPAGRPGLVHVDGYRLSGSGELEDLDLDTSRSAVVVEWGEGIAERLAGEHLLITLTRRWDDTRSAEIVAHGASWPERLERLQPQTW